MNKKLFANPSVLWIKDENSGMQISMHFFADEEGAFVGVNVFDDGNLEDAIVSFNLDETTFRAVMNSGWHWGFAEPEDWGRTETSFPPPGTTFH